MYAVGVDIGGSQTRVAIVNNKGQVFKKESFKTLKDNPSENLKKVNEIIKSFDQKVIGVGISCPGPLDLKNGIVLSPPNLPGWHNFHLKAESEKITRLPCFVENDANLAGLAEAVYGAGKGYDIVQYLTISTGIGGGLVISKEIYQGANGFAQEIANSILWKDGPQQGILKKGSLESICSGSAIVKRALDQGLKVDHAGQVNDLAKSNNSEAAIIMEDAKVYLANMIAIIIAVLDPSIIILGGGVALKIDGFVQEIKERVVNKVYDVSKDSINIVKAKLGDDNGLIGGAALAFLKVKEAKNGSN